MLNNMAPFLNRWMLLLGLALGMLTGGGLGAVLLAGLAADRLDLSSWFFTVACTVGVAIFLVAVVMQVTQILGAEKRLMAEVTAGSSEMVTRSVIGPIEPARVLTSRPRGKLPAWVSSQPSPVAPGGSLVVVTTLAGQSARRVVLSAPTTFPGNTPLLVALHPTRTDVALLLDTAPPREIQRGAADPRWGTVSIPTNDSVRGGWGWLIRLGWGFFATLTVTVLLAVLIGVLA